MVAGILSAQPPDCTEVRLSLSDKIQIVETMADLARARKAQGLAFIRQEHRLIVWTEKVEQLLVAAQVIDAKMVEFVCHVAKDLKVPHATSAYPSAGIVLVGWSHGGAVALWTLAHPAGVSSAQRETLERYLNKIIIYGEQCLCYRPG